MTSLKRHRLQRLLVLIYIFKVETPSKVYLEYGYLQEKPFYRKVWFLVALAAASIVIIIMVVAILCVKSKTYKYKGKNLQSMTYVTSRPTLARHIRTITYCLAKIYK